MKRVLLLCVLVGLFAGQASADLWSVDKSTALGLQEWTMVLGYNDTPDTGLRIWDGVTTMVYGGGGATTYNGVIPGTTTPRPMSGQVGFVASIGTTAEGGANAEMEIFDSTLGLTGDTLYTGISMYVQNDDQSHWEYQLFYVAGGIEYNSGDRVHLPGGGGSAVLTTGAPLGGLDLDDITRIGFRVHGHNMGGDPALGEPSDPDAFHTSVVPIPGALLLGFLGLGAAGVKLRRFV